MALVSNVTNSNGTRLLGSLFYDTSTHDRPNAPYTLKDYDWFGKPSLYRLYMEMSDPTEYLFAQAYLSDWTHWKMLCDAEWFKPYVARWREELELKLKAEGLARIIQESRSPGREGHSATKYLLEKGWEKSTETKGRPSKEAIRSEANRIAVEATEVDKHMSILGLN